MREVLRLNRVERDLELNGSSSNTGPEKLELKRTRGKDRLSDKYLAGLLDSDGCIHLMWNPPMRRENWDGTGPQRAYAVVSFHQKAPGRRFMELAASGLRPPSLREVCCHLEFVKTLYTFLEGSGHQGDRCSDATSQVSGPEKSTCNYAIAMNGEVMDVQEGKQRFDAARGTSAIRNIRQRNGVGYMDGNRSFAIRIPKGMSAPPVLWVYDEAVERVGIDLLQKAYGRSVRSLWLRMARRCDLGSVMDAAEVRSMFESGKTSLAEHMVLKKDRAYFILGWAKMGISRKECILSAMKQLSRPHGLMVRAVI